MADIQQFIHQAKAKGLSDVQIKEKLHESGWTDGDIANVFTTLSGDLVPPPPPTAQESSRSENMWDSFQHIIMFISLQVMAGSLALLVHQLMNKWIPPLATGSGYYRGSYANEFLLRTCAAALIVSFPVFAFLFDETMRRAKKNPAVKHLHSRKVLIYCNLIIAFLVVLVNVIRTLYNFLGGEFSLNFIVNFLTTLIIYGVMFWYYISQVREERHAG